MSQPKHLIERPLHFIEAMYDLADHGAILARTTPRNLLNIAETFAENEATEYETEVRKLFSHLSDLPGDTPAEFGLRLSGKHASGSPICSIAWSQPLAEPLASAEPSAEPTQEEPSPEPTPAEWNPPAESARPHPFFPEAMIRHHLTKLPYENRIELLTAILASTLLDDAADGADGPHDFTFRVKSRLESIITSLEQKAGLS